MRLPIALLFSFGVHTAEFSYLLTVSDEVLNESVQDSLALGFDKPFDATNVVLIRAKLVTLNECELKKLTIVTYAK